MSWYRDIYLKSEDWKNLRAAVLFHAKGRCAICNKKRKLEPHHITYRRIYDVKIRDLVPVCRICHNRIHAILDANPGWKRMPPYYRFFNHVLPRLDATAQPLWRARSYCAAYFRRLDSALTTLSG